MDFQVKLDDMLCQLVWSQQIHTSTQQACLNWDQRSSTWKCKRHAPFQLSEMDVVEENGYWHPQWQYRFINNFIPNVLVYAHCNHDRKLLSNGIATKKVAWYITKYATKPQQPNSNPSALLYKGLVYHFEEEKYISDIHESTHLLLFHMQLAVNHYSEQCAPQVVSYLMGWGDSVFSHQYVSLYWTSMVRYLKHMFPDLQER